MERTFVIEHLDQATRHVAEGQQRIIRQRELIAELERDSHDTKKAIELLNILEQTQALHIADRDRMRAELAAGD